LIDLKNKLSSEFGIQVKNIGLRRLSNFEEIPNSLNNQTLSQLNITSNDTLDLFEKDSPEEEARDLLNE
jgi:hypothetical protein